jgi:hypothetical protein
VDDELRNLINNQTPKLNPDICNGLAVSHFKKVEEYLDQVFLSASKGFPEGLKYIGCKRCGPFEEFNKVTRAADPKAPKRHFDVAKSDIYLMKYFFSFNGVELPPRYIYLPFISDAGYITLGGARFNISPLLIDRVISVSADDIFVRLLRDRLTFERTSHSFMIDGVQEITQVIWSSIYHRNAKMRKLQTTTGAKSTVLHYLLCKYGFTETFAKFGKCHPVVGYTEINESAYPEADWIICSSRKIKVKSFGKGYFEQSNVRVAVKRSEFTPMVKNMLGSFFYLVDHFPSRINPEYLNSKRLWMILMGHIIFSGTVNEGKLHDDIEDHITSLNEYLDSIVANKLRDIDIYVSDIYELLAMVMETFNDRLLEATNKISSMYEKELSILYHVLYEITSAIFMLYFKLKAASKKVLTEKEIISIMNMTLKTGLIYSITRGHGEVSTISSPGDNKIFKITSILKPQSASNRRGGRKDTAALLDPSSRLHVSVAEIGGAFNLPKASPDGRSRINPHLKMDPKGLVLRNPELTTLLNDVQATIKR